MSKSFLSFGLVGLVALLISCSGDRSVSTTDDPLPGDLSRANPFVLRRGETTTLEELGLQVKFESVISESRCPLNAYCFWPGMAEIQLRVIECRTDTHYVAVSIIGSYPEVPYEGLLPVDTLGYRFTLLHLFPYPGSTDYTPNVDYIATLSVYPYEPMDSIDGEIRITCQSPQSLQDDIFFLDTVYVTGDVITLRIGYSGGCVEHDFELYMSPAAFLESCPPQANVYLRHDDHDDMCDGWFIRDLSFDLRPVMCLRDIMYDDPVPILLNVYYYFDTNPGKRVRVLYNPDDCWGSGSP